MNAVRENPEQNRFEMPLEGNDIAAAFYRVADDGRLLLVHSEVPGKYSGRGIGTELMKGTSELLRQSGRKAVPICSFIRYFYSTHPEYADVLAR